MNVSGITSSIDVARLQKTHVAIVGLGAAYGLACQFVRAGVPQMSLFDFDRVEPANLARQGFVPRDVGQLKVAAVANELQRINPAADVRSHAVDFTSLTDAELAPLLAGVDLLVLATDRFRAQARGNQVALRLGIPAVWIGLYAGGLGGEVIFWHPGIDACFRCLCERRYRAHDDAGKNQRPLDPPSTGVTLLDVELVDAIAGQIAIGLLTRGSETRYGRLIDELGDRNFLQVKIDSHFEIGGRDIVREQLGIAAGCDDFYAWNTIARRDPDGGQRYCPDCVQFRGHGFGDCHGVPIRLRGAERR